MVATHGAEESHHYRRDLEDEGKAIVGGAATVQRCSVKMWKLQKGDSQDLQALDRLAREIARYKISAAHKTTIHRFFKPK
jgi:hypothetical protein